MDYIIFSLLDINGCNSEKNIIKKDDFVQFSLANLEASLKFSQLSFSRQEIKNTKLEFTISANQMNRRRFKKISDTNKEQASPFFFSQKLLHRQKLHYSYLKN